MNNTLKIGSNPLGRNNQRAILIYDLSITDIAERKKRVVKFDTVIDCAEHFRTGRNNIMRAIGARWTDSRTQTTYAVRDCGTTPGTAGYDLISEKTRLKLERDKK